MKRALFLGLFIVLGVGVEVEAADDLFRRPLGTVTRSGWVQVQLDADAQRGVETAWVGDEVGRSVPFLREQDLPEHALPLPVRELITGTDGEGRPMAEFFVDGTAGDSLSRSSSQSAPPNGAEVRLGEQNVWPPMTLTLEIAATKPWVTEVEVSLKLDNGEWMTLPEKHHLYDFGGEFRRMALPVMRRSSFWRVRLRPIQGGVRGVRSVEATVAALGAPLDWHRSAFNVSREADEWILTLPVGAQRVAAIKLNLKGVVAPVRAEVRTLSQTNDHRQQHATWAGAAQVWRMPGLSSIEGEVRFDRPLMGERFKVTLPEGVEIDTAEAVVAEESLWFVAEKGARYFLHLGGQKRVAPGDLAALPTTLGGTRPDQLSIGAPVADPYGEQTREDLNVIARRWLPWAVGIAVAALAGLAIRLLRRSPAVET